MIHIHVYFFVLKVIQVDNENMHIETYNMNMIVFFIENIFYDLYCYVAKWSKVTQNVRVLAL